jgi:hypothetical protein
MILCWTTDVWLLRWQQRSQLLPLLVRYFSSSHLSSLGSICKQALALKHGKLPSILSSTTIDHLRSRSQREDYCVR